MQKILLSLILPLIINQATPSQLETITNKFNIHDQIVIEATQETPLLEIDNECIHYGGINNLGTLISPTIELPINPLSYDEFKQVYNYMAVNNIAELTIEYTIPYQPSYKEEIKKSLSEIHKKYKLEQPEYFNYFGSLTYMVKHTTDQSKPFKPELKTHTKGYETSQLLDYREVAFAEAHRVYTELYNSGQLDKSMSEASRALVFLDWIKINVEYSNDNTRLCHTAWSAFIRGTGVCDAYSSVLELLLRLDGIVCKGETGYTKDGGLHHWTAAELDGNLYYIDATFYASCKNISFAFTPEEATFREYHVW